jgi:hypothetical protein
MADGGCGYLGAIIFVLVGAAIFVLKINSDRKLHGRGGEWVTTSVIRFVTIGIVVVVMLSSGMFSAEVEVTQHHPLTGRLEWI